MPVRTPDRREPTNPVATDTDSEFRAAVDASQFALPKLQPDGTAAPTTPHAVAELIASTLREFCDHEKMPRAHRKYLLRNLDASVADLAAPLQSQIVSLGNHALGAVNRRYGTHYPPIEQHTSWRGLGTAASVVLPALVVLTMLQLAIPGAHAEGMTQSTGKSVAVGWEGLDPRYPLYENLLPYTDQYQCRVADGRRVDCTYPRNPLSMPGTLALDRYAELEPNTVYLWVYRPDELIVVMPAAEAKHQKVGHPDLASGRSAYGGGEILTDENGLIAVVSNASGHLQPGPTPAVRPPSCEAAPVFGLNSLQIFEEEARKRGVRLSAFFRQQAASFKEEPHLLATAIRLCKNEMAFKQRFGLADPDPS